MTEKQKKNKLTEIMMRFVPDITPEQKRKMAELEELMFNPPTQKPQTNLPRRKPPCN